MREVETTLRTSQSMKPGSEQESRRQFFRETRQALAAGLGAVALTEFSFTSSRGQEATPKQDDTTKKDDAPKTESYLAPIESELTQVDAGRSYGRDAKVRISKSPLRYREAQDVVAKVAGGAGAPESLAARPLSDGTVDILVAEKHRYALPYLTIDGGSKNRWDPCSIDKQNPLAREVAGIEREHRLEALGAVAIDYDKGMFALLVGSKSEEWLRVCFVKVDDFVPNAEQAETRVQESLVTALRQVAPKARAQMK